MTMTVYHVNAGHFLRAETVGTQATRRQQRQLPFRCQDNTFLGGLGNRPPQPRMTAPRAKTQPPPPTPLARLQSPRSPCFCSLSRPHRHAHSGPQAALFILRFFRLESTPISIRSSTVINLRFSLSHFALFFRVPCPSFLFSFFPFFFFFRLLPLGFTVTPFSSVCSPRLFLGCFCFGLSRLGPVSLGFRRSADPRLGLPSDPPPFFHILRQSLP